MSQPMAGPLTWLLWTLGGLIAFVGFVFAFRALFADRARGRLRCPKCWYDMGGLREGALTCPECGRTAKSERRLRKTRRRYGLAGLGALVVALGAGAALAPRFVNSDPLAAVPTPILRLVLAFCAGDAEEKYEATGGLSLPPPPPQNGPILLQLLRSGIAPVNAPPPPGGAAPADEETWDDLLVASHAGRVLRSEELSTYIWFDALTRLASIGSESRVARSEVIELLFDRHAPAMDRKMASEVLANLADSPSIAALLRCFESDEIDPDVRGAAVSHLIAVRPDLVPKLIRDGSLEGRDLIAGVLSGSSYLAKGTMRAVVEDLLRTDRPFSDVLRRAMERSPESAKRALNDLAPQSKTAANRRRLLLCRLVYPSPRYIYPALHDPDPAVRRLALDTLVWDTQPDLDEIARALGTETDEELKRAFATRIASARIKNANAVEALSGLSGTPGEPGLGYAALRAIEAASASSEPIIEQALLALDDLHPPTRCYGCRMLRAHADAARADPRTRSKLNALLESGDERVRRSAVETIDALWAGEGSVKGDDP